MQTVVQKGYSQWYDTMEIETVLPTMEKKFQHTGQTRVVMQINIKTLYTLTIEGNWLKKAQLNH